MNKVELIGRLTRDPDVRYTTGDSSKCIARFSIAVNRRFQKDGQQNADFISCVSFGKMGEFFEKYCKKGMKMAVSGHIQTGSYTKDDGTKVYTTDVIVEEAEFCESKSSGSEARINYDDQMAQENNDGFMNIPDGIEEELPFN